MANSKPTKDLNVDEELKDLVYDYHELRRNYEPMAFMARQAYEGKHFIYWNRTQQHLEEFPIKKQFFNQVPETSKQADAFENFILKTDFTFTVVPQQLSDDSGLKDSVALSHLAQHYHDKIKETPMFSDFIHWALLDNVSFIEVTPNDNQDDVTIRDFTFFDILFNPRIRDWNDQKVVFKIVRKDKKDIRKSKLYNIPEDYQFPEAEEFITWQDIYEREKFPNWVKVTQDEAILFEGYVKTDKGMRIKTIDAAGQVLRNDLYPHIKRIPITPLRIYSGEWYQPSYVFRQLPMNRAQDIIFNRIEDLILTLAKGGYFVQEEEELDGEMNESVGQIIRYAATMPEQIKMASIPPFIGEYFQNLFNLSDRYGLSSLMGGQLPQKGSGVRANKMIESMKQLTMDNNAAPINNFKTAVKHILEHIFMFLYALWDTPQDILATDLSTQLPSFVSEKNIDAYPDSVGIPKSFKRFDVEVDNALGYTLDARKQTAVQLMQLGIINKNTVKKIFNLGSSAYMLEAEEKAMHESAEFQQLIQMYPQMAPDQKQALITVLKMVGQMVGNKPGDAANVEDLLPDEMKQGKGKKPKAPGAPQPPAMPTPPSASKPPKGSGGGMPPGAPPDM